MEKLRGTIGFVLYPRGNAKHPSNFRIVEFRKIDEDGKIISTVIAKGPIPSGDRDEIIELTGRWVQDKKHGRQFEVVAAEKIVPESPEDLQLFIAKEVEGIGPALAARIIKKFGKDTRRILTEEPGRLSEIPAISEKAARRAGQSWKEITDASHRSTKVWLVGRGVSPALAGRIIEHFGGQTIDVLINNPYRATEVPKVGFTVADGLAKKLGWTNDRRERRESALMHVLTEACEEQGHSFLHIDQLTSRASRFLEEKEGTITEIIPDLHASGKLVCETINGMDVVYPSRLYEAERKLAERLAELQGYPHGTHPELDSAIGRAQERMHQRLSPKQLEGIRSAFGLHVSGVTGGPGTGKTVLCKALVHVAELLGLKCRLAAPTGRAAKRLSEVTGRDASTIHRLLEFDPKSYAFNRNPSRPIEADILIVDESSMLDLHLARALFDAVPDHCSITVIGDADQLPSVGPGTVLKDLIQSRTVKFTVLDSIFRQVENSDIVRNAHRIRNGEAPQFMPKGVSSDCHLMAVPSTEVEGRMVDDTGYVRAALEKLCRDDIPTKLGVDPVRDVQVIVPMKTGDAGTRVLNQILQDALNPTGSPIAGTGFRISDRVMQLSNNYQQDVFNGDIGFVESYNPDTAATTVNFYGKKVEYLPSELDDLQLSYAQTIHKSQGSEYPVVVVVLLGQHYIMLERNLLYTATTRAQKECIYLASQKALNIACHRHEAGKRNSFLAHRLRRCMGQTAASG